MAVTYPLSFPASIGPSSIVLRSNDVVALSQSPFSLSQQVIVHPGQRWEADVTIGRCKRDQAAAWIAFLLSLRGYLGTFLMGDPDWAAPRGTSSVTPGTPVVNGAGQTGSTLAIRGAPNSATGYLLAGDCIQIGSGSTARLHRVLTDVSTSGSGTATLDIWPALRYSPTDGATVTLTSPRTVFRLAAPGSSWEVDSISSYGISFSCVEAL